MTNAQALKELQDLHYRLGQLLNDPHLGLSTWHTALQNVLHSLATYRR